VKVLLVGAGGVGEAIASLIRQHDPASEWLEKLIIADVSLDRAQEVARRCDHPQRFIPEWVDARQKSQIIGLARQYQIDLILNSCDPRFNMPIFEGALSAGCHYLDMALSLSERHPQEPYQKTHIKLGDLQYKMEAEWQAGKRMAIVGSGVEPGLVNVFARYAADCLFDEIHELNVRDGNNLQVLGHDIAFGFSIWTTIEECLNPPIIWERERGWFTTPPFSEPEIFTLPEGIGDVEMVNVEHEEVVMFPRSFQDKGLKRVTFKYGLGDRFIKALKMLQELGLERTEKVQVGEATISPRDVVAACAPNPAKIGDAMSGKTVAGLWVKGIREGWERNVYIYQVADNQECMRGIGCQAVVAQTAFSPVIMLELIAKGIWQGSGVLGPECFPADPFIQRTAKYGFPIGMVEMESAFRTTRDTQTLFKQLKTA